MINKALQIAVSAHAGQTDRDGEAYILHPLAVGLMGRTDEERAVGFLHDVLEDTNTTADDLLREGISQGVVEALRLLSRPDGMDDFEYVQQVLDSRNPLAIRVKYHDLLHNYARGKRYPDLQQKHGKALAMVEPVAKGMESVSLYDRALSPNPDCATAVFACGCFWGVQRYFAKHPGVRRVLAGYTGGTVDYPTYEEVRAHRTHHLEAVLVEYDPTLTDYESLCRLFFEIHDPSQTDGQGGDLGEQYRSCVFCSDDSQREVAERLAAILRGKGIEVNTGIRDATDFWVAEDYHQNYYDNTGGSGNCHIRTKIFD